MRFLPFLFSIFILVLLVGCSGQKIDKTIEENENSNIATGDSVSEELNIDTIQEVSNDQTEIESADTQIDEVSSLLSDW